MLTFLQNKFIINAEVKKMTAIMETSGLSASDVAKYFILKSSQEGRPITNKKLQKLVYYSYAWYLVSNDGQKKLFPERVEAWIHGPVIPKLYFKYKEFGFGPIDPKLGDKNNISGDEKILLDEIWDQYGKLDADTLEALAHSEPPWREARKNLDKDEFGNTEIEDSTITSYYSSLKEKIELHE
jgi:uncharacterized phage-associated protein